MKLHEAQDLPDDLSRRLAVLKQVERVRSASVVDHPHWEISVQRPGDKAIKRLVHAELIAPCPDHEQRHVGADIIHRFSSARVGKRKVLLHVSDGCRAVQVKHVAAVENGTLHVVPFVLHQDPQRERNVRGGGPETKTSCVDAEVRRILAKVLQNALRIIHGLAIRVENRDEAGRRDQLCPRNRLAHLLE